MNYQDRKPLNFPITQDNIHEVQYEYFTKILTTMETIYASSQSHKEGPKKTLKGQEEMIQSEVNKQKTKITLEDEEFQLPNEDFDWT